MPVVDAGQAGGGVGDWYQSLPPVTRFMATTCFLTTLGVYAGFVAPRTLALVGPWVYKNFELWRLATNLFFIAPFSIKFAFELVWLIQYGTILEKQSYMFNPADFVFMMLFGAGVLTAMSMLIPQLGMVFNASPLIFMLVYVYSRNFPNQQTSIWGLVTIQTFYLPFAFLALTVIQGGDPIPDLLGIFVGHLWWYLTDLLPRQSGRHLLPTPRWVQHLVASIGIGPAPAPAPGAAAPVAAPSGFRAFRGSGRRLGDEPHTD